MLSRASRGSAAATSHSVAIVTNVAKLTVCCPSLAGATVPHVPSVSMSTNTTSKMKLFVSKGSSGAGMYQSKPSSPNQSSSKPQRSRNPSSKAGPSTPFSLEENFEPVNIAKPVGRRRGSMIRTEELVLMKELQTKQSTETLSEEELHRLILQRINRRRMTEAVNLIMDRFKQAYTAGLGGGSGAITGSRISPATLNLLAVTLLRHPVNAVGRRIISDQYMAALSRGPQTKSSTGNGNASHVLPSDYLNLDTLLEEQQFASQADTDGTDHTNDGGEKLSLDTEADDGTNTTMNLMLEGSDKSAYALREMYLREKSPVERERNALLAMMMLRKARELDRALTNGSRLGSSNSRVEQGKISGDVLNSPLSVLNAIFHASLCGNSAYAMILLNDYLQNRNHFLPPVEATGGNRLSSLEQSPETSMPSATSSSSQTSPASTSSDTTHLSDDVQKTSRRLRTRKSQFHREMKRASSASHSSTTESLVRKGERGNDAPTKPASLLSEQDVPAPLNEILDLAVTFGVKVEEMNRVADGEIIMIENPRSSVSSGMSEHVDTHPLERTEAAEAVYLAFREICIAAAAEGARAHAVRVTRYTKLVERHLGITQGDHVSPLQIASRSSSGQERSTVLQSKMGAKISGQQADSTIHDHDHDVGGDEDSPSPTHVAHAMAVNLLQMAMPKAVLALLRVNESALSLRCYTLYADLYYNSLNIKHQVNEAFKRNTREAVTALEDLFGDSILRQYNNNNPSDAPSLTDLQARKPDVPMPPIEPEIDILLRKAQMSSLTNKCSDALLEAHNFLVNYFFFNRNVQAAQHVTNLMIKGHAQSLSTLAPMVPYSTFQRLAYLYANSHQNDKAMLAIKCLVELTSVPDSVVLGEFVYQEERARLARAERKAERKVAQAVADEAYILGTTMQNQGMVASSPQRLSLTAGYTGTTNKYGNPDPIGVVKHLTISSSDQEQIGSGNEVIAASTSPMIPPSTVVESKVAVIENIGLYEQVLRSEGASMDYTPGSSLPIGKTPLPLVLETNLTFNDNLNVSHHKKSGEVLTTPQHVPMGTVALIGADKPIDDFTFVDSTNTIHSNTWKLLPIRQLIAGLKSPLRVHYDHIGNEVLKADRKATQLAFMLAIEKLDTGLGLISKMSLLGVMSAQDRARFTPQTSRLGVPNFESMRQWEEKGLAAFVVKCDTEPETQNAISISQVPAGILTYKDNSPWLSQAALVNAGNMITTKTTRDARSLTSSIVAVTKLFNSCYNAFIRNNTNLLYKYISRVSTGTIPGISTEEIDDTDETLDDYLDDDNYDLEHFSRYSTEVNGSDTFVTRIMSGGPDIPKIPSILVKNRLNVFNVNIISRVLNKETVDLGYIENRLKPRHRASPKRGTISSSNSTSKDLIVVNSNLNSKANHLVMTTAAYVYASVGDFKSLRSVIFELRRSVDEATTAGLLTSGASVAASGNKIGTNSGMTYELRSAIFERIFAGLAVLMRQIHMEKRRRADVAAGEREHQLAVKDSNIRVRKSIEIEDDYNPGAQAGNHGADQSISSVLDCATAPIGGVAWAQKVQRWMEEAKNGSDKQLSTAFAAGSRKYFDMYYDTAGLERVNYHMQLNRSNSDQSTTNKFSDRVPLTSSSPVITEMLKPIPILALNKTEGVNQDILNKYSYDDTLADFDLGERHSVNLDHINDLRESLSIVTGDAPWRKKKFHELILCSSPLPSAATTMDKILTGHSTLVLPSAGLVSSNVSSGESAGGIPFTSNHVIGLLHEAHRLNCNMAAVANAALNVLRWMPHGHLLIERLVTDASFIGIMPKSTNLTHYLKSMTKHIADSAMAEEMTQYANTYEDGHDDENQGDLLSGNRKNVDGREEARLIEKMTTSKMSAGNGDINTHDITPGPTTKPVLNSAVSMVKDAINNGILPSRPLIIAGIQELILKNEIDAAEAMYALGLLSPDYDNPVPNKHNMNSVVKQYPNDSGLLRTISTRLGVKTVNGKYDITTVNSSSLSEEVIYRVDVLRKIAYTAPLALRKAPNRSKSSTMTFTQDQHGRIEEHGAGQSGLGKVPYPPDVVMAKTSRRKRCELTLKIVREIEYLLGIRILCPHVVKTWHTVLNEPTAWRSAIYTPLEPLSFNTAIREKDFFIKPLEISDENAVRNDALKYMERAWPQEAVEMTRQSSNRLAAAVNLVKHFRNNRHLIDAKMLAIMRNPDTFLRSSLLSRDNPTSTPLDLKAIQITQTLIESSSHVEGMQPPDQIPSPISTSLSMSRPGSSSSIILPSSDAMDHGEPSLDDMLRQFATPAPSITAASQHTNTESATSLSSPSSTSSLKSTSKSEVTAHHREHKRSTVTGITQDITVGHVPDNFPIPRSWLTETLERIRKEVDKELLEVGGNSIDVDHVTKEEENDTHGGRIAQKMSTRRLRKRFKLIESRYAMAINDKLRSMLHENLETMHHHHMGSATSSSTQLHQPESPQSESRSSTSSIASPSPTPPTLMKSHANLGGRTDDLDRVDWHSEEDRIHEVEADSSPSDTNLMNHAAKIAPVHTLRAIKDRETDLKDEGNGENDVDAELSQLERDILRDLEQLAQLTNYVNGEISQIEHPLAQQDKVPMLFEGGQGLANLNGDMKSPSVSDERSLSPVIDSGEDASLSPIDQLIDKVRDSSNIGQKLQSLDKFRKLRLDYPGSNKQDANGIARLQASESDRSLGNEANSDDLLAKYKSQKDSELTPEEGQHLEAMKRKVKLMTARTHVEMMETDLDEDDVVTSDGKDLDASLSEKDRVVARIPMTPDVYYDVTQEDLTDSLVGDTENQSSHSLQLRSTNRVKDGIEHLETTPVINMAPDMESVSKRIIQALEMPYPDMVQRSVKSLQLEQRVRKLKEDAAKLREEMIAYQLAHDNPISANKVSTSSAHTDPNTEYQTPAARKDDLLTAVVNSKRVSPESVKLISKEKAESIKYASQVNALLHSSTRDEDDYNTYMTKFMGAGSAPPLIEEASSTIYNTLVSPQFSPLATKKTNPAWENALDMTGFPITHQSTNSHISHPMPLQTSPPPRLTSTLDMTRLGGVPREKVDETKQLLCKILAHTIREGLSDQYSYEPVPEKVSLIENTSEY